jgi:mycothiol synthase
VTGHGADPADDGPPDDVEPSRHLVPEGLHLAVRRVAEWSPEVAAAVNAVIGAAEAHDGSAPVDEAVHLMLAHHGLARAALWLADAPAADAGRADDSGTDDGAGTAAFALAHRRPDDGDHPTHLELVTAPQARGRGLGGALAAAALDSQPGPWVAWSHGHHPAAERLAARHGFEATRSLWVMRLAAGRDVPHRAAPAGVTLRSFRPGDEPGVLEVNAAAFADHPEQGALDRAGFDERVSQSWFDPEGLVVAERDGEIVGFHWTKTHPGASPHGEVYVIGVAPALQGSGLGAALLSAGVEHLRSRGLGEVVLYVESDNPAVRLYERVGFTHAAEDTHVQYARG